MSQHDKLSVKTKYSFDLISRLYLIMVKVLLQKIYIFKRIMKPISKTDSVNCETVMMSQTVKPWKGRKHVILLENLLVMLLYVSRQYLFGSQGHLCRLIRLARSSKIDFQFQPQVELVGIQTETVITNS